MLTGIVRQNDNNYYINVEEENNIKTISVIHSKKNKTRCIKEEEAIFLLETILSSNLTYKEKYNDYDVYLDEADNKRYFKDGKEDFKMFFYNNGIDYIKYKNKGKNSKAKQFKMKAGLLTTYIVLSSTALLLSFPKYRYMVVDPIYEKEIVLEDAEDLILNSKDLDKEDRDYLYNKAFLNDVLEISNNNRNYSLREKLNNIKIYTYNEDQRPHAVGYYNSIEPNHIYMREDITKDNEKEYYGTLSHEFVHLLQNESDYLYIHEASAELMSYEYYDNKIDSYTPEVIRLKVLMEIIGPKPIMECNFKEDDYSLENAISNYLDEEDTKKLLKLFKSDSDDFWDSEKEDMINDEVDELLAKMYKNKTGYDIRTDRLINLIYQNDPLLTLNRCYFNKEREGFEKDIELDKKRIDLGTSSIEEVINSDEVESYYYLETKQVTEEEYNRLTMNEISSYNSMNISYMPIENITINFNNDEEKYYTYAGENYNQDEAIARGYLKKYFIFSKGKTVYNFNDINLDNCSTLKIMFKDGSIGETTHNRNTDTWGSVIRYKFDSIKAPSIKDKFSEQFTHDESKNIEILDMYEEYVTNDKSEVKLI